MKRMAIGCVLALGLVIVGGSSAQAGETSGNGKSVPGAATASSAPAYSVRDLPDAQENQPPQYNDDSVTDQRVQSHGRYVSQGLEALVPSPGMACRGNVAVAG